MFTVLRIVHKTVKRGVCLPSELVTLNGALLVGCCACYPQKISVHLFFAKLFHHIVAYFPGMIC